ncbi:MAG: hypothetical protein IJ662_13835 [Clostridia bacterium]|nr:hypothetical protein [Clostridia bacterium]MBR1586617.1 hypothetical protein [Clostridia bacterium]
MVTRFLQYSLDHNRPVKALFADTMKFKNITVVLLDGNTVGYLTAGRKKPLTTTVDNLLSVSYARGDDGDTLQYAKGE